MVDLFDGEVNLPRFCEGPVSKPRQYVIDSLIQGNVISISHLQDANPAAGGPSSKGIPVEWGFWKTDREENAGNRGRIGRFADVT